MSATEAPIIRVDRLVHRYGPVTALAGLTLELPAGKAIGLIGPDGVGKSSLLSIIAGAKRIQSGKVFVLGGDMSDRRHRRRICPRIAFMPQGLGRNLYPDLSVWENIDFFARLFGHGRAERRRRIDELLVSTGLDPFPDRPANKLSGGMRQKLGLCCALIHDPELLILDEPTTGVDPLSRRQFWELIERMRERRPAMSVIIATAYMEEAERFDWLIAMNAGRILATGTPAAIKAQAGRPSLEESFTALLSPSAGAQSTDPPPPPPPPGAAEEIAIFAQNLTRRFGRFVAVDGANFTIKRGEIFGFVGSNGCGKTTTMKMLTGLLPPSAGEARLFGNKIDGADITLRHRVGYMSQSFSLYGELSVRQNLVLHARIFQLSRQQAAARIAMLIAHFGLADYVDQQAARLPLGIRQRLSLAVAVVHEPDLLILDEPTSGVDPRARDQFWGLLIELSRGQGVTIFVSTHFMNEAARCDRVSLMDGGKVLATGTPAELIAARGAASLEDAFISYLLAAEQRQRAAAAPVSMPIAQSAAPPRPTAFSPARLLAYARRESLEFWRDPVRMVFALLGTAFLMAVFGLGITTDVEHLRFAVLDRDATPQSRAYLAEFRGSHYFAERSPLASYAELERRMQNGELNVAIEIPPGFGRNVTAGRPAEVGAWIDGSMPFRGETTRGYVEGVHRSYLADPSAGNGGGIAPIPATIETRFRYNQDFKSIYAMVPSTIALLLAMFPAILMALAVVREKELGSIINLYVTPVTRTEFVLGKQLPYIGVAFVNFLTQLAMAVFLFGVPLRGSLMTLSLAALAYVTATTAYGLVISAFTRTQIAALFGTAILTSLPAVQFSGMLTPVSSLSGVAAAMGHAFPMMYFLRISVGTFTKALGFEDLADSLLSITLFIPALLLLSIALLRKQER